MAGADEARQGAAAHQRAASDSSPAWSPDGELIAFVSKRGEDKQPQIYVIAVDGGEARRVTNVPTGVHGAEMVSRFASASPS